MSKKNAFSNVLFYNIYNECSSISLFYASNSVDIMDYAYILVQTTHPPSLCLSIPMYCTTYKCSK